MDFLRRLDPGRASAAAAARPALLPRMAAMPVPSLASLSSRLASSHTKPTVAAPEATGAWPEGMATSWPEARLPTRDGAPQAPVDGALRGQVQAASATPALQTNRAPEPLRPLAQAAPSSALQNMGDPLRSPPAKPSRGQRRPPELAPLRAAAVGPWRHSGSPMAAPGQPLSTAALQARASTAPAAMAAPAPALHLTIDRIEVRAAAPAPKPAPAQRQPRPPAVSLADYLRSGARRKAAP